MPFFTKTQLRQRAAAYKQTDARLVTKSADQILQETRQGIPLGTEFDIFLSHSFSDADIVLGLALELRNLGYRVYVDWAIDSQLDRANVSRDTAVILRKRMDDSKSLFYAATENTTDSKWMPWEAGYFDAKKNTVAILPVQNYSQPDDKYEGREYLSLYYYVTMNSSKSGTVRLYINEDPETYVTFDNWLRGEKPSKH